MSVVDVTRHPVLPVFSCVYIHVTKRLLFHSAEIDYLRLSVYDARNIQTIDVCQLAMHAIYKLYMCVSDARDIQTIDVSVGLITQCLVCPCGFAVCVCSCFETSGQ